MMRIAINGFGRIGRNFFRALMEDKFASQAIELVAINVGPAKIEGVAHAVKYDTLMGIYPGDVHTACKGDCGKDGRSDDELVVDGHHIKILTECDPAKLPWKKLKIDWVVECSGRFTKREEVEKHMAAGAECVLISAPAKDEDVSIIPGVNSDAFDKNKDKIVSLGSCTTNAFLPMLKVLHDTFIIERSFMTTIHAYTNTQVLLDVEGSDRRRSRAAAINIIPTTTGATKMMGKILPDLVGRVEAVAIRVPLPKVSFIDLTFIAKKEVTKELINSAFEKASQSSDMKGVLAITFEQLVSSDFNGDPHSVIIDGQLTDVCGKHMGKVFGWYDNEWAYSVRLKDFLLSAR